MNEEYVLKKAVSKQALEFLNDDWRDDETIPEDQRKEQSFFSALLLDEDDSRLDDWADWIEALKSGKKIVNPKDGEPND
ncbi:hypothetical protein OYT88_04680 [Sporolactobacillus sp. CQH2019]|uniref:hypothetical protein n=1 Tax=Sporolactobacillus sp. CQH2019 TaxID=3023512 RepID=UPI00236756B9|nr:hypothetical protein [Sporolactobacillus sp. CQH2019]MDD9147844.1 hypothetical protein [Sporolactobacillus sp. CQH2019]